MFTVIPYLSFRGNCEEALNTYIEAFGGEIYYLSRWSKKTFKCYKFFYAKPVKTQGACSVEYKAYTEYVDLKGKGFFFFRRDEAVSSIKDLMYFMNYGDMLAEIIVDQELLDNAKETSPNHFASKILKIGEVYNVSSVVVLELIMETLIKCNDFTAISFRDILIKLIKTKSFDSAHIVYEAICSEKNFALSEIDIRIIMELGSQPWREKVSLNEIRCIKSIQEYVDFMKSLEL